MTGIRESTRTKMRDVLSMLINNSNQPQNKTAIIVKSSLPEKSYSHTMSALKGMNLITNQDPPNSRRWSATVRGMDWLKEQMFQPNRFVNAGMTEFHPNIDFIENSSHAPAGSVSNGDVIRLNLTDIMQLVNAIIGDRSTGDMSWTRDGRNFSIQVNDGVVNLFMEAN